jgi:hypothetical protein
MAAATPGIDRARAKIQGLLDDPTLPRTTPSDTALYTALKNNKYTFGDETRLKIAKDFNGTSGIQTNTVLEQDETSNTSWRFPVDTDNNGKYDSYTVYTINFRSPTRDSTTGKFNRDRSPLDARTPPMDNGAIGGQCEAALGTTASLVGDSGWYKSGGVLKKSFFVFVANVPITDATGLGTNYEKYVGNKGFSALEFQQDISRIPISNNAVWFEDDIDVSLSTDFRLNGRVFTNSNLLVRGVDTTNQVAFYQISSPKSCYYQAENSKMIVGGNVAHGGVIQSDAAGTSYIQVHRFDGQNTDPVTTEGISDTNKTTDQSGGANVAYNVQAYNQRIAKMVDVAFNITGKPALTSSTALNTFTSYPQEVIDRFKDRYGTKPPDDILKEELENYFRQRTRRVPYSEVTFGGDAFVGITDPNTASTLFSSTTPVTPQDAWMNVTNISPLTLNTGSNLMRLYATEPTTQQQTGKEFNLGDRIIVGNNLPQRWLIDTTSTPRKFANPKQAQTITGINWNTSGGGNSNVVRTRISQVETQPDLGNTDRNGYWETEASKTPGTTENSGGLRIVTGAGIYRNPSSTSTALKPTAFLPTATFKFATGVSAPSAPTLAGTATAYRPVWPDSMPMKGGASDPATAQPDLLMRATVLYHYKSTAGTDQLPIACVSSYLDPTDATTAKNKINTDGGYGTDTTNGRSNNGLVYDSPYGAGATSRSFSTYLGELRAQGAAMFPNGRLANKPLHDALKKLDSSGSVNSSQTITLADWSAIDAAVCGLKILTDSSFIPSTAPVIPHGTIKEAAFLDGRQIKSLKASSTSNQIAELDSQVTNTSYDLPLEQRQPLEIRVTDIDLGVLKAQTIGTADATTDANNKQEYWLPNSGLIYATREDALSDVSAADSTVNFPDVADTNPTTTELVSPADLKLSPTRRPHGIRLINGGNLARKTFYRIAEKGLILASNLPVYVKADANGNFNKHDYEEFTTALASDWGNFYINATSGTARTTLEPNFACRTGQTGCGTSGDNWRPTTIIADAVTLLSNSFQDGFRANGDYDLGNWAGNSVASARLDNGFWFNNFVTSTNWNASTGYPSAKTSYLTNGVTPIQRRVNFPEYIMEICRKIPLSQCQSEDWVVGFDQDGDGALTTAEQNIRANQLGEALVTLGKTDTNTNGKLEDAEVGWGTAFGTGNKSPLARLGAGTTARPALVTADQRYARRVAFARNNGNALVFTQIASKPVAKPIGVGCPLSTTNASFENNGCEYPSTNTWTAGTHYATATDNALWFRTTEDVTGDPSLSVSYDKNRPLAYLPPSSGRKLILPDTLCFDSSSLVDCSTTGNPPPSGTVNLNLPTTDQATDYTVCLDSNSGSNAGFSKNYQVTTIGGTGNCPQVSGNDNDPRDAIDTAFTTLKNFTPTITATVTGSGTSARINTQTWTATSQVTVVDLGNGNTISSGAVLTLDGGTQSNAIFVIQSSGSTTFEGSGGGVTLKLTNVKANNVFWVQGTGSLNLNAAPAASPHRLAGNFLGKNAIPNLGDNARIDGGRFLGYTSAPNPGAFTFTAVASDAQPLLTPMLQIHTPEGTPSITASTVFSGAIETNWLPVATSGTTTFNAAFVTGDTGARPSETNGGLTNFVRFAENWSGKTARISGSFIQTKKSAFATAPMQPADPTIITTSLFYSGTGITTPAYATNSTDGFRYRGGAFSRRSPFYSPANRQWGFDVALLTQLPDLFAQRFTLPPTSPPNEYFREVSRDDAWIQTLLCAGAANDRLGGSGATYTSSAVSTEYRPSNCPTIPANS